MANLAISGLDQLPVKDQMAVGKTLTKLFTGFVERNAALLNGVYAEDADWVNAFGSVKKGSGQIVPYLEGLFADANFDAGKVVAHPQSELRVLSDTIVTVSTRLQVAGQLLVGGGELALRDNHSLRILQKQSDSSWLVVSEMYMDARQDQSYAGHS